MAVDAHPSRVPRGWQAVAARGILLALAAVAAIVGGKAIRNQDQCSSAIARVNAVSHTAPEAEAIAAGRHLIATCAAPRIVVQPVFYLGASHTPAAVVAAAALTRRYPDDYIGWLLLASVEHDKHAAARAEARANQLRPLPKP